MGKNEGNKMVKSFSMSGPNGPTSVFFAGKLDHDSLIPVGIAVVAAAVAVAVLFLKKHK